MLVCMSILVDTHAHLCDPIFDSDRAAVLERAQAVGISAIIAVGENLIDARKNLQLAAQYRGIRAAAGLYPTHLDVELANTIHEFIRRNKAELVAIGEVGLDYWIIKEEVDREVQRDIFKGFIQLGKDLDLPLNVHSRSAGRHAISMLLEAGATRIQMHAYDGKYSTALPAVESGFFFSIPPSVVRSEQKQKLVRKLPLSCLLIETDSPVLGAVPHERNEPANALVAVKAIAELKGIKEWEVMEAVSENTLRLYGTALS
jgi:TatD DNase family protein